MKVKVKEVVIGAYEYDSVIVEIDGKKTDIVFRKEDNVAQYEGKEVELTNDGGVYTIKPSVAAKK